MGTLALVLATGVFGLVLQTTFFHDVPIGLLRPDIALILSVYLGLHRHTVGGVIGSFLLGYATDTFSGHIVGLNAFAMSLTVGVVYLLSRRLWMGNPLVDLAVVFVASILKTLVMAMLFIYLAADYPWGTLLGRLGSEAIAATLFAMPIYALLDAARRRWGLT